ncbi:unnamed protein product, partial [Discosporangium mesarthrocarpum]
VADTSISVDNLNSFNAVLCTLRFFNLVQVHSGLAQFVDTVTRASFDLALQLVVVAVILSGYGMGFELGFGNSVWGYRRFEDSVLVLFQALLGHFDFDSIRNTNRILGPILFTSFIVVVFFVVLSMVLAVVSGSYDAVRKLRHEEGRESPIQVGGW